MVRVPIAHTSDREQIHSTVLMLFRYTMKTLDTYCRRKTRLRTVKEAAAPAA